MSRICGSINDRIKPQEKTGVLDYKSLIGAHVKITSLSQTNSMAFSGYNNSAYEKLNGSQIYEISDIQFRVSLDGKCFTIITLFEFPDLIFTWDQLKLIDINNDSTKR